MSRSWNEQEFKAASDAMKAAGHLSFEEFKVELEKQEDWKTVRICPRCGKKYTEHPAVSRFGFEDVCSECGTREALIQAGLGEMTDEMLAAIDKAKKGKWAGLALCFERLQGVTRGWFILVAKRPLCLSRADIVF